MRENYLKFGEDMRKLYDPKIQATIKKLSKNMSIEHNVTFNVIDEITGDIVQTHTGHNAATNSLLTGIAHYLVGDGVKNQAYDMLSTYLPQYISLGTMGLFSQAEDEDGLPIGIGGIDDTIVSNESENDKTARFCRYILQCPGFGADGYDISENNDRPYAGLGPVYDNREFKETVYCELINDSFPRIPISFRDIVPEYEAEIPKTIDIIYSGMVSTGALTKFRSLNDDLTTNSYLFISEAGLWSKKLWESGGNNGLLAGYRIAPPNKDNWNMGTKVEGHYEGSIWIPSHYALGMKYDEETETYVYDEELAEEQRTNQKILQQNILRVNNNQVVQVIWKIQIGALEQLGNLSEQLEIDQSLIWHIWSDSVYSY